MLILIQYCISRGGVCSTNEGGACWLPTRYCSYLGG